MQANTAHFRFLSWTTADRQPPKVLIQCGQSSGLFILSVWFNPWIWREATKACTVPAMLVANRVRRFRSCSSQAQAQVCFSCASRNHESQHRWCIYNQKYTLEDSIFRRMSNEGTHVSDVAYVHAHTSNSTTATKFYATPRYTHHRHSGHYPMG